MTIKAGEIWICVKYGTLISNPSSEIMRSLFDFCKVAIAITVSRDFGAAHIHNAKS